MRGTKKQAPRKRAAPAKAAQVDVEETHLEAAPLSVMMKLLGGEQTDNEIQRSNLLDLSEEMSKQFDESGAIAPPLAPLALTRLVSMSGALGPLVTIMSVNVHGFGYTLEPVIDLESKDAFDRVKGAMTIEQEREADTAAGEDQEPEYKEPSDQEVNERVKTLKVQQRREKAKLEAFFKNANRKYSFTRLCRKMQQCKESTGYGVFEACRDKKGNLVRLNHCLSWTFRALNCGSAVQVKSRVRSTDISYTTVNESVRFRRYIQIYEDSKRYFKEFGDRRTMSAMSGVHYKDEKEMKSKEPDAPTATEILWYPLDSSESDVYGMIRWSGCIPGVIGSREQAEVNLLFFRSKAIPPLVVLVSGGKLRKGAKKKLESVVKNRIKGVENFHNILILEATSAKTDGAAALGVAGQDKVRIELKPMTEHIFKDSIWSGYQKDNRHELGQSFRIPPMLRGDTVEINRATAKVVTENTESQVFGPERRDFEFDIDRTILTDLQIMLWRFKLNAPETTDAEQLVDFVDKLVEHTMSPNEARRVAARVFGMELPAWETDWARLPVKHSLAGNVPEELPGTSSDDEETEKSSERETITITVDPATMNELIEDRGSISAAMGS